MKILWGITFLFVSFWLLTLPFRLLGTAGNSPGEEGVNLITAFQSLCSLGGALVAFIVSFVLLKRCSCHEPMKMKTYVAIAERTINGVPLGVDFRFGDVAYPIRYWEENREGQAWYGFVCTVDEMLNSPKKLALLNQAGAEWFIPVLERIRDGEVFRPEDLEAMAKQYHTEP